MRASGEIGENFLVAKIFRLYSNAFHHACYTDDPMKVHSKFLEHWHGFYSTHKDEFNPSKATLLELGGGPTIHSLISACQHVSKITFSDYADTNRREIQLWKDNDAKCKRAILYY